MTPEEVLKYNRTEYLSFSPSVEEGDKIIDPSAEHELLNNKEVVISIKMDGGTAGFDDQFIHARSFEPTHCESFDWIKGRHYFAKKHLLNKELKYFGENMYAEHSISYNELTDFLYLFNILNKETKNWLSWEEVLAEATRLQIPVVPTIFVGKSNAKDIKKMIEAIMKKKFFGGEVEGVVVRNKESFHDSEWNFNIAKYVRENHVKTDKHWRDNWVPNKLKEGLK